MRCFLIKLIVTGLLACLSGCKKNSENLAYYRINDEALSFIQPKATSYYIYLDSATGNPDSVIISENTLLRKQEYSMPSGDKYHADYFHLILKKVTQSGTTSDWLDAAVIQPGWEIYFKKNAGNGATLFYYPYTTMPFFELKSSVVINGTTYQNVHCFTIQNGKTCWWVKDTGIIKISGMGPGELQTFTLLRKG